MQADATKHFPQDCVREVVDQLMQQATTFRWTQNCASQLICALDQVIEGISTSPVTNFLHESRWMRTLERPQDQSHPSEASVLPQTEQTHDVTYTPAVVCGKTFRKGDGVYRCRDCGLDDTCVLCSECFRSSSHEGHNTSFTISSGSGGCCDCGDAEAWKSVPDCPYHVARPVIEPFDKSYEEVQDMERNLSSFFNAVVHYIAETFRRSTLQKGPPQSARHFVQSLSEVWSPSELEEIYGRRKWLVVLWNDEKHSFETVIEKVKDAAGHEASVARSIAECVDSHGREVVDTYDNLESACHVASQIAQIDLMTTVSDVGHTFREEAAGVLLTWLRNICSRSVTRQVTLIKRIVFHCLRGPSNETRFGDRRWNILQTLMLYDVRLWKQARSDLRDLFVCLLSGGDALKTSMTHDYMAVYPIMMDTLIYSDREPENSFVQLSVQMFTVPSLIKRLLSEHDVLGLVLRGLTAYFLSSEAAFKHHSLLGWPDIEHRHHTPLDVGSSPFKHKRYLQLLQDLKYLAANPSIASQFRSSPKSIASLVAFLNNFQLVAPTTRAIHQHVEWETDVWVTAFTINFQLMRIEGYAAEAFRSGCLETLRQASQLVACAIRDHMDLATAKIRLPALYSASGKDQAEFTVVAFKVSRDPCSFHHPLHRLLGGLMSCLPLVSDRSNTTNDVLLDLQTMDETAAIFDEPLRTIVLMAQIRCGLWVRNGLALRQQHLHYYDALQRDFTQDLDNFLLQSMAARLDPDLCLCTILTRFELIEILHDGQIETYDAVQSDQMLEELILCLAHCLNEPVLRDGWAVEDQVKRHIIQWLALGPISFSELSRRVSERIADHADYDRTLKEVAEYKAPLGRSESGTYQLSKFYFSNVDPLFLHYSRNQREDVEKCCQHNKRNGPESPFFLNIHSGQHITAMHSKILRLLDSKLTVAVILYSLKRSLLVRAETCGSLLDITLSVVGMAISYKQDNFLFLMTEMEAVFGLHWLTSLSNALARGALSTVCAAKANWILDRATNGSSARVVRTTGTFVDAGEDKRVKSQLVARARKEALMQQFAEAQKNFADQLNESEEEVNDSDPEIDHQSHGTCIVCQEDFDDRGSYAALGYLQASGLLSTALSNYDVSGSEKHDNSALSLPITSGDRAVHHGVYASGCGHSMHLQCLASFEASTEDRIVMQFSRNHPEDPQKFKFICPLCKSVYNVLLPVVRSSNERSHRSGERLIFRNAIVRLQTVLNQLQTQQMNCSSANMVDVLFYTATAFSLMHWQSILANKVREGNPTGVEVIEKIWQSRDLLQEYTSVPTELAQHITAYENATSHQQIAEILEQADVEPFRIALWILWRDQVSPMYLGALLQNLFAADLARVFLLSPSRNEDIQNSVSSAPLPPTMSSDLLTSSDAMRKLLDFACSGDQLSWAGMTAPERRSVLETRARKIFSRWSLLNQFCTDQGIREKFSSIQSFIGDTHLWTSASEDVAANTMPSIVIHYFMTSATATPRAVLRPAIPALISLPSQLEILFEHTLRLLCNNCRKVPNDPAICLICGQLLCSQSFCCMRDDRGECNLHMERCGIESGIFLLPKKSVVVLLHGGKGTFMPAPYLDIHGEADIGFRRGRPQFLHRARYQELQEIWQKQSVPNVIARKLEAIYDTGGWETL